MPTTNRVTYSQLEKVLSKLGFRKSVVELEDHVPKKFVVYSHASTKAILPVALHKAKDIVPDYKLFGVRRDLEIYGIIEGDAFEEMLDNAAA